MGTLVRPLFESPEEFVGFLVELMRDRPADERPTRETVDRLIAVAYVCLNNIVDSKRTNLRKVRPDSLSRNPEFLKNIEMVTRGRDLNKRGAVTRAAEDLGKLVGRDPDYLRQKIRQHRPPTS